MRIPIGSAQDGLRAGSALAVGLAARLMPPPRGLRSPWRRPPDRSRAPRHLQLLWDADGAAGLPVVTVALDDGGDVLGADAMKVQVEPLGRSRVGGAVSSGACHSRGVDTNADVHVAAALDPVGGPAGYARLLGWLGGFGTVCLEGIEGTGSYGTGLARDIAAAGIRVAGVDRSDRQRRRQVACGMLD
jgi:hypothetical protein